MPNFLLNRHFGRRRRRKNYMPRRDAVAGIIRDNFLNEDHKEKKIYKRFRFYRNGLEFIENLLRDDLSKPNRRGLPIPPRIPSC